MTSRAELTDELRAALPAETHEAFDALINAFEDRISELENDLENADSSDMQDTLETVRYWLLDTLVHNKPVRDPRIILRKVESVL
jgi:flagellin-specific chaperone FliS